MAKKTLMTQEGLEKLKADLQYYIDVKRPEASEKIKEAREYGDLSENAEYDAAKEEQGRIELEIKRMQEQLENVEIIDMDGIKSDEVCVGSYVKVYDCEFDDVTVYQIVGSTEADINDNKISNESPMAKALLGKKKGNKVTVNTPQSTFEVKIMAVSSDKIEL